MTLIELYIEIIDLYGILIFMNFMYFSDSRSIHGVPREPWGTPRDPRENPGEGGARPPPG